MFFIVPSLMLRVSGATFIQELWTALNRESPESRSRDLEATHDFHSKLDRILSGRHLSDRASPLEQDFAPCLPACHHDCLEFRV